jgi:hypothetical protein
MRVYELPTGELVVYERATARDDFDGVLYSAQEWFGRYQAALAESRRRGTNVEVDSSGFFRANYPATLLIQYDGSITRGAQYLCREAELHDTGKSVNEAFEPNLTLGQVPVTIPGSTSKDEPHKRKNWWEFWK